MAKNKIEFLHEKINKIRDGMLEETIKKNEYINGLTGELQTAKERIEYLKTLVTFEEEDWRVYRELEKLNFESALIYFSNVVSPKEAIQIILNQNMYELERYDKVIRTLGWYSSNNESAQVRELLRLKNEFDISEIRSDHEDTGFRASLETVQKIQKYEIPIEFMMKLTRVHGKKEGLILHSAKGEDGSICKLDYKKSIFPITNASRGHTFSTCTSYYRNEDMWRMGKENINWLGNFYYLDVSIDELGDLFAERKTGYRGISLNRCKDVYEAIRHAKLDDPPWEC